MSNERHLTHPDTVLLVLGNQRIRKVKPNCERCFRERRLRKIRHNQAAAPPHWRFDWNDSRGGG